MAFIGEIGIEIEWGYGRCGLGVTDLVTGDQWGYVDLLGISLVVATLIWLTQGGYPARLAHAERIDPLASPAETNADAPGVIFGG